MSSFNFSILGVLNLPFIKLIKSNNEFLPLKWIFTALLDLIVSKEPVSQCFTQK